MVQTIDARGLSCPQPVINIRKALEEFNSVTAIVDNETACENVKRMASGIDCSIIEEIKPDGIYLTITKPAGSNTDQAEKPAFYSKSQQDGPSVLMVSQDKMGKGDDALGDILIKSFFHTVAETGPVPDFIIFINSGVKLTVEESELLDDLKELETKGSKILCCGTCLSYYNIKDCLKTGTVSNMYEIKDLIFSAGSLINI